LWRKRGWLNEELSKIRLRPGDVLVFEGDKESIDRMGHEKAFLLLVPFHANPKIKAKAGLACAIMLATILCAVFSLLSIEMAALTGAALVVLTRCISPLKAYESIDTKIFVFIAGAIPLGRAMEQTGISKLLAGSFVETLQGWEPFWILLVLFACVALITQVMSDAATTALFAPIAGSLAMSLGHRPEAYVVTVAMAAVTAFLTPIGHHGNLLVYGPGGYRFSDFVKVGVPLTFIVAIIVCGVAPMLWSQ